MSSKGWGPSIFVSTKGSPTSFYLNSSFFPSTSTHGCNKSYPSGRGHDRYPSTWVFLELFYFHVCPNEQNVMTILSQLLFFKNQHLIPILVALFRLRIHPLTHHFTPQRMFFDEWHTNQIHRPPRTTILWNTSPGNVLTRSPPKLPHAVEIIVVFHRQGWSLKVQFDNLQFW